VNSQDIETELRGTLHTRAQDAMTPGGPDPWLRVHRAYRRERLRRRAVATGAMLAAAAVTAGIFATGPEPEAAPSPADDGIDTSWTTLDDGRPRGALGADPAVRIDAAEGLRTSPPDGSGWEFHDSSSLRVIYAAKVAGRRVALVRVTFEAEAEGGPPETSDHLCWVGGPARGRMQRLHCYNGGGVISDVAIDSPTSHHLVAVVPRGASAEASEASVGTDGRVRRTWRAVPVKDGVVDVAATDPLTRGPALLRVRVGGGAPLYASSAGFLSEAWGMPPLGPSAADVTAALRGARGPGLAPDDLVDARAAVSAVMVRFRSDAAHLTPRVLWAGTLPAARGGGSIVVVTAGLPGQGRVLLARGSGPGGDIRWEWRTTIPADGPPPALGWRAPATDERGRSTGDVVGWLVGEGMTAQVEGPAGEAATDDGLGWAAVGSGEAATVITQSPQGETRLILGPEARPAGPEPPFGTFPGERL
jgi:hypothetical protein